MMGAVSAVDQEKNAHSQTASGGGGGAPKQSSVAVIESDISGMTHKRAHTLRALLDVTASPNTGHQTKDSLSRKFSVGDLQNMDMDDEYDPEIFKYLNELVGSNDTKHIPLTPSTSKMMRDLFNDVSADGDDPMDHHHMTYEHSQNSTTG